MLWKTTLLPFLWKPMSAWICRIAVMHCGPWGKLNIEQEMYQAAEEGIYKYNTYIGLLNEIKFGKASW